MADTPLSSFIPKQAAGAAPSPLNRKKQFSVFKFVAIALLLGSLILAGATFFYRDYALAALQSEKVALAAERDRFDASEIASVRELDRRFAAAEFLLDNHVSTLKVFDMLELITKKGVQYKDFSYAQRPSRDVTVILAGGTDDFRTVALQALQFEGNTVFGEALITGLGTSATPDSEGGEAGGESSGSETPINFTVSADIDASALLYEGVSEATVDVSLLLDESTTTDDGSNVSTTTEEVVGETVTSDE